MKELWKDIGDYDGDYRISNFGRVHSNRFDRHLKPCKNRSGYYMVSIKNKTYYIHKLVWDYFGKSLRNGRLLQIDHIDNNKLNNRIDNLQLLSSRENVSKHHLTTDKTSKYTGVCWDKYNNKWISYIYKRGKSKTIGRFINEKDAHISYQQELNKINNISIADKNK